MLNQKTIEKFVGKDRIKTNFDLSPYLTIKMGPTVPFYFEAQTPSDWLNIKRASLALKIPLLVLGGGSNLVILKTKPYLLVVKNRYVAKKLLNEDSDHVYLQVSSGYPVSALVKYTIQMGYSGFEHQLGLPGTVGGAIYMNSKWAKNNAYFGDNLTSSRLINQKGKIIEVNRDYFQFAYDYSFIQKTGEIVLNAVFKLKKTDPSNLAEIAENVLKYRKLTQPTGVKCSGCFFKNIKGTSAGFLIDKAGLKGFRVGDFVISEKHANFIINEGQGNPQDLLKLLQIIKTKVKKKFGVDLKEEVVVI